jgi:hypothetical protein
MVDVHTSEVTAYVASLNVGLINFVCWQIFKVRTAFNETIFMENQKFERGGLFKVKIYILFYGDNS